MTGEYANQTYFVTDMDALDYLAIKIVDAGVKHAAAFSDGIQRLALHLQDGEPHAPFFALSLPPWTRFQRTQVADLEVPLRAFLDSASVNERTDDDKTLVLVASRL